MELEGVKGVSVGIWNRDYKCTMFFLQNQYSERLTKHPASNSLQLLFIVELPPCSLEFLNNDFAEISEVVQPFLKGVIDSNAFYRKSVP